ncbi:MAG TPA: polysaccharide deacetylase family protein [Blastocatellia bacterium]|nr:polysaccharide deacetylase family protein [Blastocatellia bacterium]
MKFLSITTIALLLFVYDGCSATRNANQSRPQMSKCKEALSVIPEVAALLKARGKQNEETDTKPLAGMEIVLTINRMVRTKVDPDANADDLCFTENTRENFDKLVTALKQNNMPPTVDFIVGQTLDADLQEEWLRNSNLIGNMTFSRFKPIKGTAQEFIDNIARNDQALDPLWKKYPPKQKYFRYPGLRLDADAQKLSQIKAYLKQKGYVEVPATIDARDSLFAQSYCGALARGDQDCANFIKANFKSVLLDKSIKARAAARDVAGREIKHILMIRANQLTCDMLGEILAWYKALGARFITLDEALSDPFYASDTAGASANAIIDETMEAQLGGGGR